MTHSTALVQKLWNYCNILRDDNLSYGDHVDQLTFLLFVKMADEQTPVVSSNLQRATRLRQSILQRAFTGQIV